MSPSESNKWLAAVRHGFAVPRKISFCVHKSYYFPADLEHGQEMFGDVITCLLSRVLVTIKELC